MFDTDFVTPQLPVNYFIVECNDKYILFFHKQELGAFYHYGEAVDRAIQHFEYLEWRVANAALFD